jgi:hypothetical protein
MTVFICSFACEFESHSTIGSPVVDRSDHRQESG